MGLDRFTDMSTSIYILKVIVFLYMLQTGLIFLTFVGILMSMVTFYTQLTSVMTLFFS